MQGDAADLPRLISAPVDTVVCSMALQLLQPLHDVLAAVAAVLHPTGRLVATTPTSGALKARDKLRWLQLLAALRIRLRYPNDHLLGRLPALLTQAGLDLIADEHRRFTLPIHDHADARRLVSSLYLPDIDEDCRADAEDVAAGWDGETGISIRRIVARRLIKGQAGSVTTKRQPVTVLATDSSP